MPTLNQARLYRQGAIYVQAVADTARKLGPDHQLTKLMGSMAWGRSDFELGLSPHTASYIRFSVGHEAMWKVYRDWCNIYDRAAGDVLFAALYAARAQQAKDERGQ